MSCAYGILMFLGLITVLTLYGIFVSLIKASLIKSVKTVQEAMEREANALRSKDTPPIYCIQRAGTTIDIDADKDRLEPILCDDDKIVELQWSGNQKRWLNSERLVPRSYRPPPKAEAPMTGTASISTPSPCDHYWVYDEGGRPGMCLKCEVVVPAVVLQALRSEAFGDAGQVSTRPAEHCGPNPPFGCNHRCKHDHRVPDYGQGWKIVKGYLSWKCTDCGHHETNVDWDARCPQHSQNYADECRICMKAAASAFGFRPVPVWKL